MAGYKYKGTEPWVPATDPDRPPPPTSRRGPAPKPKRPLRKRGPKLATFECGSLQAYRQHLRLKQPPCQPCKDAGAAHRRTYYRPRRTVPLKPCGTPAAFERHIFNKETPCDPCRQAKRDDSRARSRTKRKATQ